MKAVPRREWLLLGAILLVGAMLRLGHPGSDVPWEAERTNSPLQDALWYLEAASGPAEGSQPEHLEVYDLPVWTSVARVWFALAGVSLGSLQALGALVALVCILMLWRVLRPGLGPVGASSAAATLAVLYPYVALSRTSLIYGPVTLVLLLAAAVWLRGRRLATGWRIAHEAAAWGLVLGATVIVRPPAAALVGGLLLGHAVRGPRLRRPLAVGFVGGGLLLLVILLDARILEALLGVLADMGGVWRENALRLRRYTGRGLSLGELLLRLLQWGSEPSGGLTHGREMTYGRGSGYFALAPVTLCVAALGVAAAALDRRHHSPARRETLALFVGWGGAFALGCLLLDYRPLRYFMLFAPCVAALVGYLVARTFEGRATHEVRPFLLAAAVLGAIAGPHLIELFGLSSDTPALERLLQQWRAGLGETAELSGRIRRLQEERDGRLVRWAVAGAVLAFGAGFAWLRLPRRPAPRVLAGVLLALALGPATVRSATLLARPGWQTLRANRAAGLALTREGSLVAGPAASFLCLGNGIRRLRAGNWMFAGERLIARTLRTLREKRCTHIALDEEQAVSSQLVSAFLARGVRLHLVGAFPVQRRGSPWVVRVLLLRLPNAERVGYRLSEFERRRLADERGQPLVPEVDISLLEARIQALLMSAQAERAQKLAKSSRRTDLSSNTR